MATFVMTDVRTEINAANMSTLLRSATVSIEVDEQQATAMAAGGWRALLGGIKEWEVDFEFNQDFAAGQLDATIWPLIGTLIPVKVRPTSAVISATNPEFQGTALVSKYSPLDGSVGDIAMTSFTWPGSGALVRAVA